MDSEQRKILCLSLMRADTEEEVIQLLREAGYWENPIVWRFYGDYEGNYNTIGNQQSRPDAALVEKLINAIDARLMNECLVRAIDPEGPLAPRTIQDGVARFFGEGPHPDSSIAGCITEWPDPKRTQIARGIALVATGMGPKQGNPCFTIADCGEGQTPERMPETLLSLVVKSNKLRIPFVQGKFNMGSTGVLKFCGRRNMELIVSRRNPLITECETQHPSDEEWGFTVVRREDPEGGRRTSVYTYLAPLGAEANPRRGSVLSFTAPAMPIFPETREPYSRLSSHGTLIKLYEYAATGYKSNIIMRDGMLSRMDILLPEVALPIRLHECRKTYKGHVGSFETTLAGVRVRLEDNRADNLEFEPSACPISVAGEHMTATIFAFKKGTAETYRKNEGIIFTLNGQTHGHFTPDFFRRKSVGLSYLADSILVVVDCSKLSGRAREDLFMNSRDRLSGVEWLRPELERALEEMLKHHQGLRDLRERRRREEIDQKLHDDQPLENVLESLIKQSPMLTQLFLRGQRASNPFKTVKVQSEEKPFEGKRYPTYFKHKGKEYGSTLERDCHTNVRCRISFETDAGNDYFERKIDKGEFSLFRTDNNSRTPVAAYVGPNLHNGIGTLSVQLPADCEVGQTLHFTAVVTDPSRVNPFENAFEVTVKPAMPPRGGNGQRHRPPGRENGDDREIPSGISLPKIQEIFEPDWGRYNPSFDKYTALRIRNAGVVEENGDGEGPAVYDFYVNMDNIFLKSELKQTRSDQKVVRSRFKYGMVLLGLALLQQDAIDQKSKAEGNEAPWDDQQEDMNIEDKVEQVCKAVGPVLLPMIDSLSVLDENEGVTGIDEAGEAV